MKIKDVLCATCAIVGGLCTYVWGGWTMNLVTLVVLMGIDFVTGLFAAGIFHMSTKSENGKLESNACLKGLIKKIVMLLFVAVANLLDRYLSVNFLRGAVIVGFMVNEVISIMENGALMGITSPAINKALDILKKKEEDDEKNDK